MSNGQRVEARLTQRQYLLLLLGEFLDELHRRFDSGDEAYNSKLVALIRGGLATMFAAVPEYGESAMTAELRACLAEIADRAESGELTRADMHRYQEAFLAFQEALREQ